MAVTVKKVTLWRSDVDNRPGMLAEVLEPLAAAKVDLQMVVGFRLPDNENQAVIALSPVVGKKAMAAARTGGLAASARPALLAEGDNQPGLGYAMVKALADAGINLRFVLAQVIGRRYSALFGLESEDDARKAVTLIKRAGASKKR